MVLDDMTMRRLTILLRCVAVGTAFVPTFDPHSWPKVMARSPAQHAGASP